MVYDFKNYNGQLSKQASIFQINTDKCFVVNGSIEKADLNYNN